MENREIIVLQGRAVEDTRLLADVLSRRLVFKLWNSEGNLLYLTDAGTLEQVSNSFLRDLIDRHFVSVTLVRQEDRWVPEPSPLVNIDPRGLNDLVTALLLKVARCNGAGKVRTVSPQIKSEIRDRVRSGEPRVVVAADYKMGLSELNALLAQAA